MNPLTDQQRYDLFSILVRYFNALQDGTAERMRYQTRYQWRYFNGEMTVDRIRQAWEGIDTYLDWQINWVNQQQERNGRQPYEAGPEMNRLPDDAMIAMMQEIDDLLANAGYSQEQERISQPVANISPEASAGYEYY